MARRLLLLATLLLTTTLAAPAHALGLLEGSGGDTGFRTHGSLLAARTLGQGEEALAFQFGWPGIAVQFLHGQTDLIDVGGKFGFQYGFEGTLDVNPGLRAQGTLRLRLYDQGRLSVGLRFDPGLVTHFRRITTVGLTLPLAATLGFALGDAVMLHFGVDVPFAVFVYPDTVVEVPVLVGFGGEYHLDSHLTVGMDARFGPAIFRARTTEADFSFRALATLGYRF